MSPRLLLLFAALAVLSLNSFYFPSGSFSLQHRFISGENVSCAGCHPSQAGNLSLSAYHSGFSCRTCHNVTFSSPQEAHSATIPRCIDCHSSVVPELNSTYEAHMPLFRSAYSGGIRRGPNEACIACHTNASVNLSFHYYDYIDYIVENTGISAPRSNTYYYNVLSVTIGPQRSFSVQVGGGSTHYWKNTTEISCVSCHQRIKLGNTGNSQGSQHADDLVYEPGGGISNDPRHQNASYGGATDAYCRSCHRNSSFDSYGPQLNSSAVHAALMLSCLTCHNASGPYPPSTETPDCGGHYSEEFFPEVAQSVPRRLTGDFCTGCHRERNHDGLGSNTNSCPGGGPGGTCANCHTSGGGNIENFVYTEPKAAESDTWVIRTLS